MEWAKFLVYSFLFGGVMLMVFLRIFSWFVRTYVPRLEATREAAFKDVVADLRKCLAEERLSCRQERKERDSRFAYALQEQVEERRRERKEFLAVLDRLDRSIVSLAALIRAGSNGTPT